MNKTPSLEPNALLLYEIDITSRSPERAKQGRVLTPDFFERPNDGLATFDRYLTSVGQAMFAFA